MKARHLFANVVTGLEAGCLAGVLCFGASMLPAGPQPGSSTDASDRASNSPESAAAALGTSTSHFDPSAALDSELWTEAAAAGERTRSTVGGAEDAGRQLRAAPVAAERRTERDYYREYRAIAARGASDIEQAARAAIAGEGPDCQKVAALRAAADARSPAAFDLFADAALAVPGARRPGVDSVPRFAVRYLADRAARADGAARALERLAWDRELSSELRCMAAAGLASAAGESEAWRIVSRLETEQDTRVRASASQALADNPSAGSAARAAAQWLPAPPVGGEPEEAHE